jgi:hypothetical protein
MIPAHVTKLPEPQQVFLLSRAMMNICRGVYVADKMPAQSIQALLVAATRNVDPNFGSGQGDEDYLNSLARRVGRALPWLGRRPVEDAARAYAPAPTPNMNDWVLRVRMTATRSALLVADDVHGSLTLLRRLEGDLARLSGNALDRGLTLIADAMRFVVSDNAATVRRRLGL